MSAKPAVKTPGPIDHVCLDLISVANGVLVKTPRTMNDGYCAEPNTWAVFNDSDAFAKWMREWHAKCLERGKAT